MFRRILYKVVVIIDLLLSLLGLLVGIFMMALSIATLPLLVLIITIPFLFLFYAFSAITFVLGLFFTIVSIMALRGGKISYWILTIRASIGVPLAIVSLIMAIGGGSIEILFAVIGIGIAVVWFLLHLAAITVVSPKFCRRYRPLCLIRG